MILIGLSSSVQMLIKGMLGEYVEVKRRPVYVIANRSNLALQNESGERPAA